MQIAVYSSDGADAGTYDSLRLFSSGTKVRLAPSIAGGGSHAPALCGPAGAGQQRNAATGQTFLVRKSGQSHPRAQCR